MDLRTLTRIVATADLILTGATLRIVFVYSNFGLMETIYAAGSHEDRKRGKGYIWFTTFLCWIPFVMALGLNVSQFFAVSKLFSSTQFRMQPGQAADRARFWRNVTFVFILMGSTHETVGPEEFDGTYVLMRVIIVMRLVGLFIVYYWIKEMDELNMRNNFGTPCVVYGFGDAEEMPNTGGDNESIKV